MAVPFLSFLFSKLHGIGLEGKIGVNVIKSELLFQFRKVLDEIL